MGTPRQGDDGADLYLSTSSAGGGLQMLVTGVIKNMTAESAQRAALGAGAIVIDVIAVDDGRQDHQRVAAIRSLRPDMVLMSGGVEGGTIQHLLDIAEILVAADPKPRLDQRLQAARHLRRQQRRGRGRAAGAGRSVRFDRRG